jgi:cyclopropane-fatty-acyl-phospholipid synthase
MLDVRPGDRVLEIGCGWGAFAVQLATEHDCHVTAITLSEEQLRWSRQRVAELGLEDKIDVRLQDYRDVSGTFDRIASIEMFEAVGEAYWPAFMDKLRELLGSTGRAALQVITIDDDRFERYRRGADFIQRYVFPGGMLPSPKVFGEQSQLAGLKVADSTFFGASYAQTLSIWNERFQAAWEDIEQLGFSQRFKRLWEFYLAYCEAGFRAGAIDVGHFLVLPETQGLTANT